MSIKVRNNKKEMNKEGIDLMKDNKYNDSINLFTKVIEIDSNDWRIFVNICYCYQQNNQLNEALIDANIAIKLDETQIASHYRKGCVLLSLKRYRLAEKALRDGLKRVPNDENSILKLKENFEQFIKIFGFVNECEVNCLTQLYDSCSPFTDAFIAGQVMEAINPRTQSMISRESVQQIPDQSLINKSVSVLNDIHFDCDHSLIPLIDNNRDVIEFRTHDIKRDVIETNNNVNDFRVPKTFPIFRKSNKDLIRNECKSITTVETPKDSSLTNGSIDSSLSSTPKKLVKTRPTFRISLNH